MKKKQRISSSITKSTTTTITKEFRSDHPTTTKSELEEEQAQDTLLAKGPRKVSIPGHEQYSEDRPPPIPAHRNLPVETKTTVIISNGTATATASLDLEM